MNCILCTHEADKDQTNVLSNVCSITSAYFNGGGINERSLRAKIEESYYELLK